ncbi:MAG: MOSC domain-containing protein, partial [Gammaproteobacteria bacterium]|nr:MOSC domain-containing protein [Gammaproteobacteria bacterium]
MGCLLGIAVRERKRAPMHELERAQVTMASGVAGDFRGRPGQRQVTVLAREEWQAACTEVGEALPWLARRANLYIEGVALHESVGSVLHIG